MVNSNEQTFNFCDIFACTKSWWTDFHLNERHKSNFSYIKITCIYKYPVLIVQWSKLIHLLEIGSDNMTWYGISCDIEKGSLHIIMVD